MYDAVNEIQIIIPIYNDQEALKKLLPDLLAHGWSPASITVVDASPKNPYPLQNEWHVQVIHPQSCQRGRAKQMNLGAQSCQAPFLLFLHADTYLPPKSQELIFTACSGNFVGGGFSRRFDSKSSLLQLTCVLADLRGKLLGWYFGDQAIFCRRDAFLEIGGYREISPFEDLDFCRRLKSCGRLTLLKPAVLSSARRFSQEGTFWRSCKDFALTLQYFARNWRLKSQ